MHSLHYQHIKALTIFARYKLPLQETAISKAGISIHVFVSHMKLQRGSYILQMQPPKIP